MDRPALFCGSTDLAESLRTPKAFCKFNGIWVFTMCVYSYDECLKQWIMRFSLSPEGVELWLVHYTTSTVITLSEHTEPHMQECSI